MRLDFRSLRGKENDSTPAHGASLLLLLPPLLLTVLIYASIVRNYFHDDDFRDLFWIVNRPLMEYLLTPGGGHVLLTRHALFALSYHAFGMRPHLFFATVLLNHLINVALLFLVIRGLTASTRIACVGAALWGASAVHENTLGWYSASAQASVATLLLIFLIELNRIVQSPPAQLRTGLCILLFFAAVTSFALGLVVAIGAPLLAFLILPPGRGRRRAVLVLSAIAMATPLLYVALHRLHALLYGHGEALPAALAGLAAWRRMPGMAWQLLEFGTLYQLLSPVRTTLQLPAWVAPTVLALIAAALALALVTGSSTCRRQIFGFLTLCLGCYALIAAGRARLLRGAGTLGNGEQLRYQYLATVPLILALCIAARQLGLRLTAPAAVRNAAVVAYFALVLVSYTWFGPRRAHQEGARNETIRAIAAIRAQIAAQPAGTTVTIANRYSALLVGAQWIPHTVFPGWAGLFTIVFPENVVDGRRVVFSDPDPKVVAAHAHGRRTASLIVQAAPAVSQPAAPARSLP